MHLPDPLALLNHYPAKRHRNLYLSALLALLGCVPVICGPAAANAAVNRFERLRSDDLRVATVAYHLSIANVARCAPFAAPQTGVVLHDAAQYGLNDRADAARAFGLDDGPGVMAVVEGSPAEQAGLRAGDRLVSVDGRPFDRSAPLGAATRAGVERADQMIAEAMRHGPVVLRVSSPAGVRELRFQAESGCPADVELVAGDAVNAWADGSRVMVSEGLLRRCASDGDLALVIGHELAHNLLHHRRRLAAAGIVANTLLPSELGASDLSAVRETEEEADRLAAGLATTASYDLSDAERFLGGLLSGDAPVMATHPAPERRLALLRAAIADAHLGRMPATKLTE